MARKRKHASTEPSGSTPGRSRHKKTESDALPDQDEAAPPSSKRPRVKQEPEEDASSATLQSNPSDEVDLSKPSPSTPKGKARAEGWGDATEAADAAETELERLKKAVAHLETELSFKEQVIASNKELVATIQSAVNCHICMETFKNPVTLLCGHTFCGTCLWDCFHASTAKGSSIDGSDDEEDTSMAEMQAYATGRPLNVRNLVDEEAAEDNQVDSESETSIEVVPNHEQPLKPNRPICPDCRAPVEAAPTTVFVVKDVVDHIRLNEQPAGLLYDADREGSEPTATVKLPSPTPVPKSPFALGARSPRKPKSPTPPPAKPAWDPKDKTWGGLFSQRSKHDMLQAATRRGLADLDDGVRRCIYCNWEIEDNECAHCGAEYGDSEEDDYRLRVHRNSGVDTEPEDEEDEDEGNISDLISDPLPVVIADSDEESESEAVEEILKRTKRAKRKSRATLSDSDDDSDQNPKRKSPAGLDNSDSDESSRNRMAPPRDPSVVENESPLNSDDESKSKHHRRRLHGARSEKSSPSKRIFSSNSPEHPKRRNSRRSPSLDTDDLELIGKKKIRNKKTIKASSEDDDDSSAIEEIVRPKPATHSKHFTQSLKDFAKAVNNMRQHTDDEEEPPFHMRYYANSDEGPTDTDSEEENDFSEASESRIREIDDDDEVEAEEVEVKEEEEQKSGKRRLARRVLVDTDAGSSQEEGEAKEEEKEIQEEEVKVEDASDEPSTSRKKSKRSKKKRQ